MQIKHVIMLFHTGYRPSAASCGLRAPGNQSVALWGGFGGSSSQYDFEPGGKIRSVTGRPAGAFGGTILLLCEGIAGYRRGP